MEAEKANLTGEKQALEMEKTGIKEELVRVEQEKMDLDTEKMGRCTMCTPGKSDYAISWGCSLYNADLLIIVLYIHVLFLCRSRIAT
jgi:hypothetical protein